MSEPIDGVKDAVASERERCAKIAEDMAYDPGAPRGALMQVARAIRAKE